MFQPLNYASAGIDRPLDILAIAAHPDDVEQTCGGTLIRMAEMGYRTGVLDLTAGDMGSRGTPERRVEESAAAASKMSLAWRGNLYLPDARLENTIGVRMTLAGEIRNLRPRVVILPYWEARHPDHYRAGEIGFEREGAIENFSRGGKITFLDADAAEVDPAECFFFRGELLLPRRPQEVGDEGDGQRQGRDREERARPPAAQIGDRLA